MNDITLNLRPVKPDAAGAPIRAIYDDTRHRLRLPWVGALFQGYAMYPHTSTWPGTRSKTLSKRPNSMPTRPPSTSWPTRRPRTCIRLHIPSATSRR